MQEEYEQQVQDDNRDNQDDPIMKTLKRKHLVSDRNSKKPDKIGKKPWQPKKPRHGEYNNPKSDTAPQASGFMEPTEPLRFIQIDLKGMDRISAVTYDALVYRDQRIRNHGFTKDKFRHICNMVVFYRLYYNAQSLGVYTYYNIPGDFSTVAALKTLELPSNIVDYVQTLGRVILDHQRYSPYVPTIEEFFAGPMNIFYELDEQGNRIVDAAGNYIPCTLDNFVQQCPIFVYTIASLRALTVSKGFVCVDFEALEGKPELSVSYKTTDYPHLVEPRSFASQSNAVGNRGASYRFWNSDDEREFGDLNLLDKFFGVRFNDEQLIANTARLIMR